jgi:allantoicase
MHKFDETSGFIKPAGPITHVRISIYPDGGISRVHLFGKPVLKSKV